MEAGYRVAVCDQVEDPAESKGLVRREVTRIVTPGTLSDPQLLDGRAHSSVAAIEWDKDGTGAGAFLEVATGRLFVVRWGDEEAALEDLRLYEPREVLVADAEAVPFVNAWAEQREICLTELGGSRTLGAKAARSLLEDHLEVGTLRGFGLEPDEAAVRSAAHALSYARDTQGTDLAHVRELELRPPERGLVLDSTTLLNLEVFRNARDGSKRGSLRAVIDETRTAAGSRLLESWLKEPLRLLEPLMARFDAVEELLREPDLRADVRRSLDGTGDVERLLARAALGTMTPREAAVLRDTLRLVPRLKERLVEARAELLVEVAAIDAVAELRRALDDRLEEEPAATLKRGGVIAAGVDDELDDCRSLARDSKQHIMELQARQRERTGIQSLKVRFNKVFGYYIEITKANLGAVPEDYERKQTLVNAERFVTPELKEIEEKILGAEERQLTLEAELFDTLRAEIATHREALARLGRALARLDVLASFAESAEARRYVRPEMLEAGEAIDVRDGRHPVVERLGEESFVPNDALLERQESRIVVLTGPNMGGKSTYLRQVALIVLMAQAGSFVPAGSARIGLVDRIFTRVGASDDLTRGESTFMVEMIETANILRFATDQSLVILDEVGRGTATFDGLSLAWAIVEHLERRIGAKTLFATHYHELTELASLLPGVVNRTMLVKEWEDRIVFLRRRRPGRQVVRHPRRPVGRTTRRGAAAGAGDPRQPGATGVRPQGEAASGPAVGRRLRGGGAGSVEPVRSAGGDRRRGSARDRPGAAVAGGGAQSAGQPEGAARRAVAEVPPYRARQGARSPFRRTAAHAPGRERR